MLLPDADIRYFRLPRSIDRGPIERFVLELYNRVTSGRAFTCLLTTDAELQRLNHTFRRKNYATDVLSFPISPEGSQHGFYLGDLAISWQRAREQAQDFRHSIETEIQVLLLHGVLHLTGLDHETDRGRMARVEHRWRREFGLPAGLIERVSA